MSFWIISGKPAIKLRVYTKDQELGWTGQRLSNRKCSGPGVAGSKVVGKDNPMCRKLLANFRNILVTECIDELYSMLSFFIPSRERVYACV